MNQKDKTIMMTKISKASKKIFKRNGIFTLSILLIFILFSSPDIIQAFPQFISGGETISKISDLLPSSSGDAIGCNPADLITAINNANSNPGPDVINLPENCSYELTTFDNFNSYYDYNGFPIITSAITINARGAKIKSLNDNMRAFEISPEGSLSINNLEIQDFESNDEGGAILNYGVLTVSSSTFFSNTAIKGGAIYNLGDATIYNSTFSENRACCCIIKGADGGAINNTGTLNIINATFSNNSAKRDGDTFYNAGGTINLKNSITTTDAFGENCSGDPLIDGGGNLRWPENDASCVGQVADPKLSNLDYNGGLTRTYALIPGSAAIDTGLNAICAASPANNSSQNDVLRPYGSNCDIGAYELEYPLVSSITRANANPTNAEEVQYTVIFSESVTGVDTTDFHLTVKGVRGAAITDVNGVGTTYNVTVETGNHSGTIQLDLLDDDSIKGTNQTPLGLVGLRNGNFSNGDVYTIDRTPPFVKSITLADPNPNASDIVDFKVTFSEPVNGVDKTDFVLIEDGLKDTAITRLNGTDDTYTITASTGTGAGSLTVNVIDNDSISDMVNNPLGGEVQSNGSFSDSQYYKIRVQTFADVPITTWSWYWIERIFDAGITSGCELNPLRYCPEKPITRAEMAVLLEKGMNGAEYDPPPGIGNKFLDVTNSDWYLDWVEQLSKDQITQGCSTNPPLYCPEKPVTRAQMAIFLLKAKYGGEYSPEWDGKITGFSDVPNADPAASWIWQLASEGITSGCGDGKFCPTDSVTREQMAAFLVRLFLEP